ncbi:MAG: single-stranded DNA-binding protein [Pedobacter sp.]|nr:MAG: single-stranded DNA-binding protein [Pedobacter sp.]
MRGMNRVMLVGNLGKDPEVKILGDGISVARIQLATTEVFRDKDGTAKADTQWHTVIFWRGLAELAGKYLRKGSLVYVEGKMRYRKYEDKEGVMRYVAEVMANHLLMLDKRMSESKVDDSVEELLPF